MDRLPSIIRHGLLSDAQVSQRLLPGTTIGINNIKERRRVNPLMSRPKLRVGDCVPFYFCPRSIMLYLICIGNHPDLTYRGGQEQIVHLKADLKNSVAWANKSQKRWVFTLSNAGANYFEDYNNLQQLGKINWNAVGARNWQNPDIKEGKQAEFLMESHFPWILIEQIGVCSTKIERQVKGLLPKSGHCPRIAVRRNWYYQETKGEGK